MENVKEKLPWICPEHPHAEIMHTWDETHFVVGGLLAGLGIKLKHRYECVICGRELAPDPPKPYL